jgi:hypothetical protein
MSSDDIETRVETLEERLDTVEETLSRYRREHALLLAQVDIDALGSPSCPECDSGALSKESGLSWAKAVCQNCRTEWIISE